MKSTLFLLAKLFVIFVFLLYSFYPYYFTRFALKNYREKFQTKSYNDRHIINVNKSLNNLKKPLDIIAENLNKINSKMDFLTGYTQIIDEEDIKDGDITEGDIKMATTRQIYKKEYK